MIKSQLITDKFAASLSLLCVFHCFFAPSFLILSSAFVTFTLDNEFVHKFILFFAVPLSTYALFAGYKNHKEVFFIIIGGIGLMSLIFAVILGEPLVGEYGEKALTLFGSVLVGYAHLKNHQTCKQINCNCHE